jgi:hypothetical protein
MLPPRYSWQTAYNNATTVTNPAALRSKIYEALAAFEQRRSTPTGAEEAEALAEAEQILRMLHDEPRDPTFGANDCTQGITLKPQAPGEITPSTAGKESSCIAVKSIAQT